VLVISGDIGLSELVAAQAENLGCQCTLRATFDDAASSLAWADAAVIDLAGGGVDDLSRLRVEAPRVRVLAVAPGAATAQAARSAGVDQVLLEPFSIADVVTALRGLVPASADAQVIDLRTKEVTAAPVVDDAPWFSTR
jgi:DNA-binding response OmpR family regulator